MTISHLCQQIFELHRNLNLTETHGEDSLHFHGWSRQKKNPNNLTQQQQSIQLKDFVLQHEKGIFNTKPRKTSNGIGRETTECSVNNIKIPTGQKKKRKQSQQIYVHIHMKKRAVSGVGEEAVKAGIDKPCIFTLR